MRRRKTAFVLRLTAKCRCSLNELAQLLPFSSIYYILMQYNKKVKGFKEKTVAFVKMRLRKAGL